MKVQRLPRIPALLLLVSNQSLNSAPPSPPPHPPPLPLQVFSMQRVQKKFNARRGCLDRTYEYYLPAHLLLGGEAGGAEASPQDPRESGVVSGVNEAKDSEQIMPRFRTALAGFVGTHAFHNYTSGSGRRRAAAAATAGWRGGKVAVSTSTAGYVKPQGDRADAADAYASASDQYSNGMPGDRSAASEHTLLDAAPTVTTSPQVLPAAPTAGVVRPLDLHPDPGQELHIGQQLHPGPRDEGGGGSSDDDEGADGGERDEEDSER